MLISMAFGKRRTTQSTKIICLTIKGIKLMKRRFTLTLLAAICCLVSKAAVSSVDDIVGYYTATTDGWEGITDYSQWTAFSTGHDVTIAKNESGTLTITNLLGLKQTLEASVDVEAKTVTIAPQKYYWYYTLADSADVKKSIVGTIDDEGNIKFTNFNAWYGNNTYFYTGAEVTLTKQVITEEWTVKGTLTYTEKEKAEAYHTATTTLTKYAGTKAFDYGLKFDGENASPADVKIKVYNDGDSIAVANGTQTAGYNGGYFYYTYGSDYSIWLEGGAEGTSFIGDQTGGTLTLLVYDYATKDAAESTNGTLKFVWGNGTGVEKYSLDKADDVDAPVYDLTGRKASNPAGGIYIKNGKKFVVK